MYIKSYFLSLALFLCIAPRNVKSTSQLKKIGVGAILLGSNMSRYKDNEKEGTLMLNHFQKKSNICLPNVMEALVLKFYTDEWLGYINKYTGTQWSPFGFKRETIYDRDEHTYNKDGFNIYGIHSITGDIYDSEGFNARGCNKDGMYKSLEQGFYKNSLGKYVHPSDITFFEECCELSLDKLIFVLQYVRVDMNIKNHQGETAFFHAYKIDNDKAVEYLMNFPAINFNTQNMWGETLLIMACKKRDVRMIKILLHDKKVDNVNQQDRYGNTGLHYIAKRDGTKEIKIMALLLQIASIDVNIQNKYGQTPLHLGCEFAQKEGVAMLLAHIKIRLDLSDEEGNTPKDVVSCKLQKYKKIDSPSPCKYLFEHLSNNVRTFEFLSTKEYKEKKYRVYQNISRLFASYE